MATPIKIRVDVEMQDVINQAKKGGQALEDMGDSFGDVEDASQDAARTTTRSLDDMVDSFGDVEDAGQAAARSADDIGKIGPAADNVSGALGDLGGVAQDVLGGDFASGAKGAISSVTGIASSIPGIGIAAGIAAAGVGLVVSAIQASEQATAEAAKRASEWADAYIAAGDRIVGASSQVAAVQEIATDPDRYKEAQVNATNWGVDVSTAMLAMAGNAAALAVAQETLAARTRESSTAAAEGADQYRPVSKEMLALAESALAGAASMNQLTGDMAAGQSIAGTVSDALLKLATTSGTVGVEVDALGNKLLTLPDNTQIVIDAKTELASQAVSKFKGDTDGVIDYLNGRDVSIKAKVDDAAVRAWKPPVWTTTVNVKTTGVPWKQELWQ